LPDQHLGRAVDNALPDLYQRAADLHVTGISDNRLIRIAVLDREVECAEATQEALLAFTVDIHLVMLRLADLVQLELAHINALDSRDSDINRAGEFVSGELLEFFASGDKVRQTLRIIKQVPHALARRR